MDETHGKETAVSQLLNSKPRFCLHTTNWDLNRSILYASPSCYLSSSVKDEEHLGVLLKKNKFNKERFIGIFCHSYNPHFNRLPLEILVFIISFLANPYDNTIIQSQYVNQWNTLIMFQLLLFNSKETGRVYRMKEREIRKYEDLNANAVSCTAPVTRLFDPNMELTSGVDDIMMVSTGSWHIVDGFSGRIHLRALEPPKRKAFVDNTDDMGDSMLFWTQVEPSELEVRIVALSKKYKTLKAVVPWWYCYGENVGGYGVHNRVFFDGTTRGKRRPNKDKNFQSKRNTPVYNESNFNKGSRKIRKSIQQPSMRH